mmetsp:Transcript_71296/g.168068  ORF Transcript_71296/g.168068 Transcript_71296/m.168068 type:complete len:278 (+) Transcript_71296:228-1061(+)
MHTHSAGLVCMQPHRQRSHVLLSAPVHHPGRGHHRRQCRLVIFIMAWRLSRRFCSLPLFSCPWRARSALHQPWQAKREANTIALVRCKELADAAGALVAESVAALSCGVDLEVGEGVAHTLHVAHHAAMLRQLVRQVRERLRGLPLGEDPAVVVVVFDKVAGEDGLNGAKGLSWTLREADEERRDALHRLRRPSLVELSRCAASFSLAADVSKVHLVLYRADEWLQGLLVVELGHHVDPFARLAVEHLDTEGEPLKAAIECAPRELHRGIASNKGVA